MQEPELSSTRFEAENIDGRIAIVGMGCRFPGAPDPQRYWRVIRNGIDAISEVPRSRWDIEDFFDPTGEVPGKMSNRWGAFLEGVDQFDPSFFRISPREAEKIDPQQRLLLEVAWEALEHGGQARAAFCGSSTGVFVGMGGVDYSRIPVQLDNYFEQISVHSGTGNALSIAANRISYVFDLRGPSMVIDTACSSSLVATHLAVRSLRSGECDLALAGGVNLILTPETTIAFSKARMLSPDGVCRPFDADANGYVRGEGCGMIVLKRLADALAARDNILAVIRGSAVNQDGQTSGITAPRGPAQQAVIGKALADSALSPRQITYVEAHGTATPLGDPIEVRALGELFRCQSPDAPPVYLGSVKANIGHTETAAGVASLIKVVLMMQHECVPGQTHFNTPNPYFRLEGTRLCIPRDPAAWHAGEARIAGVSSFGFGGTNAHVVLQQWRQPEPAAPTLRRPLHLLTFSAKTAAALGDLGKRYREYLRQHPRVRLPDACYSANTGRCHFEHRVAIVAEDREQLRQRITDLLEPRPRQGVKHGRALRGARRKVAFLFTGQGAQYVGMGRRLFDTQPVMRDVLLKCDEILRQWLDEPLLSVLYEDGGERPRLDQTAYTQPALFALEYALATLWRLWGVEPDLVLGHSVGEYVAACVAGVFSLEDGLRLIAGRARLMQQLPSGGSMAVVLAEPARVAEAIVPWADRVAVAANNGPRNTVISGHSDSVRAVMRQFESAGVRTQKLNVSHAFHSPLMEPILDEFAQLARTIDYRVPRIPFVANLSGDLVSDHAPDAEYWTDHLRHTVRFQESVRTIAARKPDAMLEIGPSTTLLGMARRCSAQPDTAWLPSLRPSRDDWQVVLESLSELYVRGVAVDWEAFDQPWPRRHVVLPTYPFQRKRCWYDLTHKTDGQAATGRRGSVLHPLLGRRVPSAGTQTLFEATLGLHTLPYLAEHRVKGSAVFPAAALIEQALAAANQTFGPGNHEVESLSIQRAMVFAEGKRRVVQVVLSRESHGDCTFQVHSRALDGSEPNDKEPWSLHACGTLHARPDHPKDEPKASIDLDNMLDCVVGELEREPFYRGMADCGLAYGPTFQVLAGLKQTSTGALARVELPSQVVKQSDQYHLHPALLDACFQSLAGVVPIETDHNGRPPLYLPTFVRQVRIHAQPTDRMWIHAERTSEDDRPGPDAVEANVYLLDQDGTILAELVGARGQRVEQAAHGKSEPEWRDWLYAVHWQVQSLAEPTSGNGRPVDAPRSWLVFADRQGVADRLASRLGERGQSCMLVRPGKPWTASYGEGAPHANVWEMDPLSPGDYQRVLEHWTRFSEAQGGVIHLWSLDLPAADPNKPDGVRDERRLGCGSVLQLAKQWASANQVRTLPLYLITRGAQPVDRETEVCLSQTSLWGLGRTAAMEFSPSPCRLVDLDPSESAEQAAAHLADELTGDSRENQIGFRAGIRHVARLEPAADALRQDHAGGRPRPPRGGPFSLRLGGTSSFDSLRYVPLRRRPPQPGQVEIEVHATGLNFSDVLKAMGLYPGVTDEIVPLGIECAGIVTAVGEGADRFRVGDRVMGVAPYSFASHAVTAEYTLVPTPDQLTDEQACTIPITFLTAHYALCRLADLQPGERVLIHAGAGGVGQAAIQIAQRVEAEVFATAGSDQKREFLRRLGVEHVMNSRTLDFADQILHATGRRGVDVVLNSLPGDAITKSISVLASYGRFLEIGKTDIYQNRMIGLLPFQDNLSYFAIDLDRMLRQRPDYVRSLFAEVMQYFDHGQYQPLPLTSFSADRITDAFRFMAQRKNIGKVVVNLARPAGAEQGPAAGEPERIRGDGTYLVTGGLGALGLQVGQWLAAQGAKHLALIARHAPGKEVGRQLEQLGRSGVRIAVLEGDVTDAASLAAALDRIPDSFPVLRGVLHAAGVLADGLMFDMDLQRLDAAMDPKVVGAWNVHQATRDLPIDFFVLFSSVASVLGSPGQANYAAGNAFLDGLAHYRRSHGLPATSINWGPWADGGMAAGLDTRRQLARRGMVPLPPETTLRLLGNAITTDLPNLAVMDVHWSDLLAAVQGAPPPLLEHVAECEREADGSPSASEIDEGFRRKLRGATAADRQRMLGDYIAAEVAVVMGIDRGGLDSREPLGAMGLDSLMGMELKAKVESRLGVELPMGSLFDNPTITSLARLAGDLLGAEDEAGAKPAVANSHPQGSNGEMAADAWSPLVALAHGGSQPPLFCVHPVGGDLRCYGDLARCLGDDRPVWGLRARGLDVGTRPHRSMEALAADYVQAIQKVAPEGPYYLAGWSTGGIYAYEIAHQLRAAGATVGGLAMIDTPMPSVFRDVDLDDDARFLVDVVNFSNWFAGTQMQVRCEQLRGCERERSLQLVLDQARQHGVLTADASLEHLRRLMDVCKQNVRVVMQYEPLPLGQGVHMIRPADTRTLSEASGQALDEDLGWGPILDGQTIHRVPGNHFSMMTGQHAPNVARKLQQCFGKKPDVVPTE